MHSDLIVRNVLVPSTGSAYISLSVLSGGDSKSPFLSLRKSRAPRVDCLVLVLQPRDQAPE